MHCSLVLLHIFIHFLDRIGSQLVDCIIQYLILVNLLAVAGGKNIVASGGKFYQLLPDKENTRQGYRQIIL